LTPVIRICTSHRTENLLDAFVQNLQDERARSGPFVPVQMVVPNRNIEAYLRLRVAERCGIAANLEAKFLRGFLTGLAERAVPGARVADATHVECHLLALLHDDAFLATAELAPVTAYLTSAGADRDALDRRRCQLASALARLFEEYAGSRPDMLGAWAQPTPVRREGTDAELATWQRILWRAVFAPGGRLDAEAQATGMRHAPLDVLWALAMAQTPPPFAGGTVHVFGLSYMAGAYQHMLASLGRQSEVRIYTLAACREDASEPPIAPPESMASGSPAPGSPAPGSPALRSMAAAPATAGLSASAPAHDPLRLLDEPQLALRWWARPGRENLRLLASLEGAAVEARFDEASPDGDAGGAPGTVTSSASLLARLQGDIVARRQPVPPASQPDDSLRVLPCPSLRRELEVVAAEIWALARRDSTLRLCDVLVVVPEASKDLYLAQVAAVFGESSELPHNIADLPDPAAGRVGQAITLLLDLPFSSFTRKEVLPLLTHPCILGALPDATPEAVRAWVADLGIVRGADRADLRGTYLARDLFTWDQGLKRLALGAFADHARPDAAPFTVDGEAYLPGPPLDSDGESKLGFGLLVRALIADARFASDRSSDHASDRPLSEWLDFMRAMLGAYLVLDKDDGAGKAALAAFLAGLAEIEDAGIAELRVSYRVATELAKRALDHLPQGHGHYLAGGVTVASFVPMRAIPFRAVFVLGLGQHTFPRPAQRHELDLRAGQRRVGDVDSREQDLYMFLETLLSARDQIVLSYVARDEITGEALPPSSVLGDLRTLLGQGYLQPDDCARLFHDDAKARPPLRRYDDSAQRRSVLPAAEDEHRAKVLGRALVPPGGGREAVRAGLAHVPATSRAAAQRLLVMPDPPERQVVEASGPLVIRLSALWRFLQDPLQGAAHFHLGLRQDDDREQVDLEDEPFDANLLVTSRLMASSMTDALVAARGAPTLPQLLASHHRHALAEELAGVTPTGLFRRPGLDQEANVLAAWLDRLPGVLGTTLDCHSFRLLPHRDPAEAQPADTTRLTAPRFELTLPSRRDQPDRRVEVVLTGETGLWATSVEHGLVALTFTAANYAKRGPTRHLLRAFLDHVVLAAAGVDASAGGRSAIFHLAAGAAALTMHRLAPVGREQATRYLANLCAELLVGERDADGVPTGMHPYLLPHEAVLEAGGDADRVLDEIDRRCEEAGEGRGKFSTLYGPLPSVLDRYEPPSAPDVERMVHERFGLYFELVEETP
jgi:exodeoxyribonuclease V gamma subunit